MWNYLFFFLYLKIKPSTDYTAQESYVKRMLEERNVAFFPIQQSGAEEVDHAEDKFTILENKIEKLFKLVKSLKPDFKKGDKKEGDE